MKLKLKLKLKSLFFYIFSTSLSMDENVEARIKQGRETLFKLGKKSAYVFAGSKILSSIVANVTGIQTIEDLSSFGAIGATSYYTTKKIEGMTLEEKIHIIEYLETQPGGPLIIEKGREIRNTLNQLRGQL
jgi:hypothetical protein